MEIDLKKRFFDGMSQAACTVNVVTTDGAAGRAGVTVSAMSSVSADTPRPTLLVFLLQWLQIILLFLILTTALSKVAFPKPYQKRHCQDHG